METNCNNLRGLQWGLNGLKCVQHLASNRHIESASIISEGRRPSHSERLVFLSAPRCQGSGCALQPMGPEEVMHPPACKHRVWIQFISWQRTVVTAQAAHEMGNFLTGISAAGDPKLGRVAVPMWSSPMPSAWGLEGNSAISCHPHSRQRKGRSLKEGMFFGERWQRATHSPLPTSATLGSVKDGLLARMDDASDTWQETCWARETQRPGITRRPARHM